MTKEEFLKELNALLVDEAIINKEEVMLKYTRFFEIGSQAGMSDEEIIATLGTPLEILKKLKGQRKEPSNHETKDLFYNLDIDGTMCDNVCMKKTNTEKIIINIDEELKPYLDVFQSENTIKIASKKGFQKNHPLGDIEIEYGSNVHFGKIKISSVTGDIELGDALDVDRLLLNAVTGDIKVNSVNKARSGEMVRIGTVSGDITCEDLNFDEAIINTVNGDFNVSSLNCHNATLTTVNGDGKIMHILAENVIASTVNGDIFLMGKINNKKISSVNGKVDYTETK